MKKAFTLIEVLISVMILALVGLAVIKNSLNALLLFENISRKSAALEYVALIANHRNPDYNNLSKSLYDFLENSYIIDDHDVVQFFKSKKFLYKESLLKLQTPNMQESFDSNESSLELPFLLMKITIKNKNSNAFLYTAISHE